MASTSSNSARTCALNTTELLENILLHLPPVATIRCRQVHPTWKNTIAASPQLRQHIFLDPKPPTELLVIQKDDKANRTIGTLSHDLEDLERGALRLISLHPALRSSYLDNCPEGNFPRTLVWFEPDCWRIRAAPEEWHRMFVTQPPVSEITIELPSHNVTIEEDGGVTMGTFFDEVPSNDERPLSISWGLIGRPPQCVLESSDQVEKPRHAARIGVAEDRELAPRGSRVPGNEVGGVGLEEY